MGSVVSGWLGTDGTAQAALQELQSPGSLERLQTLYATHEHEVRLAVLNAELEGIRQTNETYRAEVGSEDEYVRRARPGFVYALKWTWMIQVASTFASAVLAIFADAFGDTVNAGQVISELAKLNADTTLLWAPALAVIGVYNVKRSNDKQVAAGQEPTSILSLLKRG